MRVKARALGDTFEFGFASTGTEQVGVRVVVVGGDYDGHEFTWYGYFTEASEDRTIDSLKIMGWDGTDVVSLPGLGSTEFELQLEEQLDEQGHPYWRPTFVNRMGVAMKQVMDPAAKASFAARINAKMRAQTPASARTAPQQRQAPAQRQAAPQQRYAPPAQKRAANGSQAIPDDAPMPDDPDLNF
jgi:hypothetical protein